MSRSTWVLAAFGALAGSAGAAAQSLVGTCGTELVFDLSGMAPDVVFGEIWSITSVQGEIVNARVDAVFVSNESDPWSIWANFEFPTGVTGVSSEEGGWTGVGTFEASFETDALNGILVPTDGSAFTSWFLVFAGGTPERLPRGGVVLTPMDGYFETLTLTIELADCPTGDLTGDYIVDGADLGLLLGAWGDCPSGESCGPDLNQDGAVDGADLGILLGAWGSYWCPPPFC